MWVFSGTAGLRQFVDLNFLAPVHEENFVIRTFPKDDCGWEHAAE